MKRYIFLFSLLVVALVACSNEQENTEHNSTDHVIDESLEGLSYNIDGEAWSPMMVQFFQEVDNPRVENAYELAIQYADVLDYMPCYCGCYESDGHENNTHCFVDQFEGNIATLDSMGFGCGICIEIAETAVAKYEEGESLIDIRNFIDEIYSGNDIDPTPTPMPEI
ncbi:PCYCGC motif-containing (lipo)protein [Oceanobacillus halotolerans]|uniref:PCYCGC motif-containing (lipo)protein n=1 Tax=Oceanobacillus halotolerans TaxID=2663380 RepID=UPI0013DABC4A|nr:PCYCGC motif-containing (lipo)protein [Oceanobacillus halotolerans]